MADGLLNKASIILTPTGYKAGTLYNVAPVVEPYEDFDFARASVASRVNSSGLVEMVGRTLGSELVTNGDFSDGTNDWINNASAILSIENDKLKVNVDGAGSGYGQQNIVGLTIGKTYKINAVGEMGTSTRLALYTPNAGFNNLYTDGTISTFFIASSTTENLRLYVYDDGAYGFWDNVSVKEVIDTNNIPRINYDSNGDNGHILLEPTSTNLITYSEDFEAGSWTNESIGTTPTLDGGYTAPDGSNSAYKISNANQDSFWYYPSVADSDYARTIWARTVSGTGTAQLTSHNSNTNNTFNLTETWQRFEVNSTTSSIGEQSFYAVDFRGSGTLTELLIWGAQLEDLPYATSYIPTLTGSQEVRATETATGAGSADLINSTEGVLYFEGAALAETYTSNSHISLSNGSTSNRLYFYYEQSGKFGFAAFVGNVLQANIKYDGIIANNSKVACKYKENDYALWVDGVEVGVDTSASVWSSGTFDRLNFDGGDSNNDFYGKCKALAVFNEALSDSELNNLTG
jgi:hypothetical protein